MKEGNKRKGSEANHQSGKLKRRGTESERPLRLSTGRIRHSSNGRREQRETSSDTKPKSSENSKTWSTNRKCLMILRLNNSTL